jgi:hypothetical protein
MFRAYGSFPSNGTAAAGETKSLRNPLENIQTWGASPIAPPPTPTPSTTSSSSPDFHTTQPNISNQRHNALRHLQQNNHFQNNLHAHNQQQQQQNQQLQHQQQQQQQQKSSSFFIEQALNNNNNSITNGNGFKNNDIKGRNFNVFS